MIRMLAVVIACVCALPLSAQLVTAPKAPASGPGSAARHVHAKVDAAQFGEAEKAYWLFRPAGLAADAKLPVVVFCHGWNSLSPLTYRAWIDHLVKQGRFVVFPAYQVDAMTSPKQFSANALHAVKAAFVRLGAQADRSKWAIAGHSAGGMIAANLAALAVDAGLTAPGAVMPVQPGVENWVPYADLTKIPKTTLLLTVSGDRDSVVGDKAARTIVERATSVPPANRNHVHMRTDRWGAPALIADHYSPGALIADAVVRGQRVSWKMSINALDHRGYWKLFDGLCDAAFYGKNRKYALGNTPEQRSLGAWSDGRVVKEMVVHVPKPPKPIVRVVAPSFDVAYGPGKRHTCDVFPPAKGSARPLVLFVHGGAWKAGNKDMVRPVGVSYAKADVGVCSINYRLTPQVKHPEHARDVVRAIAWALAAERRGYWAERGVDPTKLVLAGHSAGAHLVALAALDARRLEAVGLKTSVVKGVIPFAGVYWLPPYLAHQGWQGKVIREVFGATLDTLKDGSPAAFANGGAPPFLVVHGEKDQVVEVFQAELLRNVLKRHKVDVTARLVPKGNHGSVMMNTLKEGAAARKAVLSFIRRVTAPPAK